MTPGLSWGFRRLWGFGLFEFRAAVSPCLETGPPEGGGGGGDLNSMGFRVCGCPLTDPSYLHGSTRASTLKGLGSRV